MPKFFVQKCNIDEPFIKIDGEDVSHIKKVLRMREGEEIDVCDSSGFDYKAVIDSINDKDIVCKIKSKNKSETEPPIKVTLFQGLPKASKMDYIIQKNTELGISEIVPCALSRCVVKLEGDKKTARWQKISEEAAKQSGRGIIPKINSPVAIDKAIDMMKEYDLKFVPYECEEQTNLKSVLLSKQDIKTVGFMIGPEGGFDKAEIEKLKQNGIIPVSLGKRILRTETAGEAVLSMIMYEIGDINL